jgi:hypothetical protein
MALYQVASGGGILAADVNQIVNTLTAAVNNPVALAGTLAVTGATTLTGGVAGVMAATGNVTANGNRCVEGTAAATHAEVYPAQGSVSVASSGTVSYTLTFARSFASLPAVSGSCMNGGAIHPNATWQPTAISTTATTFIFENTDPGTQTMTNFSIMAQGA